MVPHHLFLLSFLIFFYSSSLLFFVCYIFVSVVQDPALAGALWCRIICFYYHLYFLLLVFLVVFCLLYFCISGTGSSCSRCTVVQHYLFLLSFVIFSYSSSLLCFVCYIFLSVVQDLALAGALWCSIICFYSPSNCSPLPCHQSPYIGVVIIIVNITIVNILLVSSTLSTYYHKS